MPDATPSLPIVDSLLMYLMAIAIAFVVALAIKGIVGLTGQIGPKSKPASATATPTAAPAKPAGPPAGHIAAITAAVAATLGAHRIVHIEDARRGTAWSAAGRSDHQTSHHPHPRH